MYVTWLCTYEGEDAKTNWKDLFALKLMERGELLIFRGGLLLLHPFNEWSSFFIESKMTDAYLGTNLFAKFNNSM